MAEYIEREALEVALNHRLNFLMAENGEYDHYTSGFDEAVTRVEDFPAADVAPVRHGRWIYTRNYGEYECSVCHGIDTDCNDYHSSHVVTEQGYCPNCGAKMDLGGVYHEI